MLMKSLWDGKRFEILFSLALAVFTAYALLDTFVIPRQYALVDSTPETVAEMLKEETPQSTITAPQNMDDGQNRAAIQDTPNSSAATRAPSASNETHRRRGRGGTDSVITENTEKVDRAQENTVENASVEGEVIRSWSDENIAITVTQYRACQTDVYVADVTLSSPEYLKTTLADNTYGRNIKDKTSVIASENQAVLAINGDYYGARNSGYVLRNGILYRESGAGGDVLAIFDDGSFQIADDRQITARELLDAGAVQILSFGPALLKDGNVTVTQGQEVGKAMVNNPRTAIGVIDKLHYVFVVADGRTGQSAGMSLYELAEFLRGIGVDTAYNLDGGGSSTMVFNGEILNHPTTSGNSVKERSVSDIVYIGS